MAPDAEEFGIRDRHEYYRELIGYLGEDHSMHFEERCLIHNYFDRFGEWHASPGYLSWARREPDEAIATGDHAGHNFS